jgi:hypothetical protein
MAEQAIALENPAPQVKIETRIRYAKAQDWPTPQTRAER